MSKKMLLGLTLLISSFVWEGNIVQAESQFPTAYETEEGKVKFHAVVEAPEDLKPLRRSTADNIQIDGENAFQYFCSGKDIIESHEDSSTGEFYRKLADGSSFSYIPSAYIAYMSENMPYYWGAFRYYDNSGSYSQEQEFDFATKEACVEELVKAIEGAGYGRLSLNCNFYYLDFETMRNEEIHENVATGEMDSSKYKESWGKEDNAYQIYANQEFQGLPVYHSIKEMPEDDDTGCLISGIYSSRGFENVVVIDAFNFHETGENIKLLSFEECAKKVTEKYNRLLTESVFTVNRATLYQYIERDNKTGKKQKVIPIWYFDILEEGPETENPEEKIMRNRVMLVNAETGEEIITE